MCEIPSLKVTDKILIVDDRSDLSLKLILDGKITANITFTDTADFNGTSEQYDTIITTVFESETASRQSLFASYYSALRPGGLVYLYVSESHYGVTKELEQNLQISGFINCSLNDVEQFECLIGDSHLQSNFDDLKNDLVFVKCIKPNYEVGSSKKISLAEGSDKAKTGVASVWKLDDEDDYIDANDLLNEDDVKRPDPSSLKVCGTTGKRKACKDCSCGLAEELEAENNKDTAVAKSSCGSCYLGDAFRCASCPYLGMPAFKPGEKIQLNDQFLAPDI